MAIRKVYFRFDADSHIGAGHLVRCVSIGRAVAAAGRQVYWASKNLSLELEAQLPLELGPLLRIDPKLTWAEELSWLDRLTSLQEAAVVLDVATPYALNNAADFNVFLDRLRQRCHSVLIDGLNADAILGYIAARPHIAVVPYVGAERQNVGPANGCQWLLGPKYFVLQPEYQQTALRKRPQPKIAKRVLITFGGTDPKGSTLLALDAVAELKSKDLRIRTVMGPGFSNDLRSAIADKAGKLSGTCVLEDAPDSLAGLISWCDVAVSASGLTKYELAALGKPSLQVSLNGAHALAVEPFVATGATQHLGIANNVTAEDICLALDQLIHSIMDRTRMQTACRRLIDGKGTERVVDAILAGAKP